MSFFHGCKTSQINGFLFVGNLRYPWFFVHPFCKRQPFKTMFVCCFTVCSILSIIAFAQILKSIVRLVPINVINLIFRPFFCHVKPRQSVRGVVFSQNFYMNISTFMKISSLLARPNFWSWFGPYKLPRFRVIVQKGLQLGVIYHTQDIARIDLEFQLC